AGFSPRLLPARPPPHPARKRQPGGRAVPEGRRPPPARTRTGREAGAPSQSVLAPSMRSLFALASLGLWVAVLWPQAMVSRQRVARRSRLVPAGTRPPQVRYEDLAASAGLRFRHVGGDPVQKQFLVEATGSGVALFDYDNDGLLDIFLVNGTRWKPPFNA